jgi:AsmA protein
MATDPGTPAVPTSPKKGSTFWRIVRLVLIGAVACIALLLIFPPTGLIKDQLAKRIGAAIGRTVTIGDLRLKLRPKLEAEFDRVAVSNPSGMPERDVFRAETIKTNVDLLPLIKGRVRMNRLELIKPLFALEEGADGTRNWVFDTTAAQAPAPTAAAPTAADATEPVETNTTAPFAPAAFSLPPESTIVDGTLTFQSAKTGAQRTATAINSTQTLDPVSGALASKGNLSAGGESVAFDAAVGDFHAIVGGTTSTLKANVDARPLRASIDGIASFSAAAEFTGALTASSHSLIDLARWFGSDITSSGAPLSGSLDGQVKATTRDVTFTETGVMVDTTSGLFDGVLDLGGVRPKLAGTLASEHVDLGRATGVRPRSTLAPTPQTDFEPLVTRGWEQLLNDLNTLENGPQAAAAEPALSAATASPISTPGWSEQPFNLKALQAFDLDLVVNAAQITYGTLDLKQGRLKAGIAEGVLDGTLEELAVGDGKAVGTFSIDSRASPPRAKVQLSMTNVAAEPIVTELTGKPLLAGTSNVEITASAAGQNQSQLTSTLDGKAHFLMGQGALRGFDVRRMIFEWWKSWSFDLSAKTGFTRLEAQYDIKKGILRSEPGLAMGGSEVEINSAGTVNVPKKTLNQEIRVKAIPPPTAFPIPIKISGNWAKPSIGIDWGGLFSSAPGLGGPQALAQPPEPPPANVQAAIRRVLAADLPEYRLSSEARQMLNSLLPAGPGP